MISVWGTRLCEVCWRVVVYPYKTVPRYRHVGPGAEGAAAVSLYQHTTNHHGAEVRDGPSL